LIVLVLSAPSAAADRSTVPAEERRFNSAVFREGLKKRGLTELLELHLRDFPPQSGAEQLLLERDAKLSQFRDVNQPAAARFAALSEANFLLDRLVRENPDDPRRFDWLYTLAHSLIFDQGAPYATNILYTGGSDEDRTKLAQVSASAVKAARTLIERLESEFARLDNLTAEEFEKTQTSEYMAQLDRIAPNAEYLLLWALFYDSLPRKTGDPVRAEQLNEILTHLSRDPLVLKAPQEQTHVQIPATVLAGMTYRHLGDYHNARQFLDRARSLADRLSDANEKVSVYWAVLLADIEAIRADRDDERWQAAKDRILQLRERIQAIASGQVADTFSLTLAAALLERSVNLKHAEAVQKTSRLDEAESLRAAAWRTMAQLLLTNPGRRDELLAAVDRATDKGAAVEALDPIEQTARVAGLIEEAETTSGAASEAALAAAATLAQHFLAHRGAEASSLDPQMLRYLAVAQYRTGDLALASASFTKLACTYPTHADAPQSAVYAVQLAAKLYHQKPPPAGAQRQYKDALQCLLDKFAETAPAEYWRFFYAQLLDELGEHDEAAAQFAAVQPTHKQYVEAAYFCLRSLAAALQHQAESSGDSAAQRLLSDRANAVADAQRELARRAEALDDEARKSRPTDLEALLAEGVLLTAESNVLTPVARYRFALDLLSSFESRFAGQTALMGRVWRARLLAYSALRETDRLAEAVPHYVAADPKGAGGTLQSLYNAASTAYVEAQQAGQPEEAERRARAALPLAEQLVAWTEKTGAKLSGDEKRYLFAQLAEANLRARRHETARGLFAAILPPASQDLPKAELDVRIILGYAQSLTAFDDCEKALPLFNQLATGLPAASPMRWEALAGDLACRTLLDNPPEGIIKVIDQQKLLYPDLGGPLYIKRFEAIRDENERRLSAAPASTRH
jgi:hypothetical protein